MEKGEYKVGLDTFFKILAVFEVDMSCSSTIRKMSPATRPIASSEGVHYSSTKRRAGRFGTSSSSRRRRRTHLILGIDLAFWQAGGTFYLLKPS
jgi:hypothetical protein